MSSINSHIISYLDDYIKPNTSSEFAVLLTGSWGSGKTWFIQQYIRDRNKVDPVVAEYPFLLRRIYGFFSWFERQKLINMGKAQNIQSPKSFYISLYGAKSISDIEERMVISIAHKIDTGFFSLQSKYLYGVISEIANGFKRVRLSKLLPVSYFLQKNLARSILIFDDLERCDIDCNDLFGFINSFLEQENLKVILIVNEGKIANERKKKYDLIKEKLVGKTFVVASDFDAVYNNFVDIIEDRGAKQTLLLEDNKKIIFNLFQEDIKSKKHTELEQTTRTGQIKTSNNHENNLIDKSINLNLRTLRQIILDFEKIFKSLPEIAENKAGLLENILKALTIFSIETRSGGISTSDISKLEQTSTLVNYTLSQNSNQVDDENLVPLFMFLKKWKKDGLLTGYFPDLGWWQNFFEHGVIDKEYLNKSILNSPSFSATPNWSKLIRYQDLSDEEFNQTLSDVESDYSNKKYEEIEIVKHIAGVLLYLNELGFYIKDREIILKESTEYVDYLKTIPNKLTSNIKEDLDRSSYYSGASVEFKSLCDHIDQVRRDLKEENWSNVAKELLDAMQQNYEKFRAMILGKAYWNEEGLLSSQYPDTPVLIYIDSHSFVNQLLAMRNDEQGRIFDIIKERYNDLYINRLGEELDWLKSIRELMILESNTRKLERKISGFLILRFIAKLDTIIEKFNE